MEENGRDAFCNLFIAGNHDIRYQSISLNFKAVFLSILKQYFSQFWSYISLNSKAVFLSILKPYFTQLENCNSLTLLT